MANITRTEMIQRLKAFTGRQRDELYQILNGIVDNLEELSDAELAFLDGITAGTGLASKALVLDANGDVTMPDLGSIGFGGVGKISWDTTDANANELLVQLPAGGATDVPVVVVGQAIEGVDLGLYNGVTEPRVAILSSGAVTTGPVIEMRKARGTTASPTVVTSGDDLGTIDFYAAVAAGEYVRSASIRADASGTIATTRGPGNLSFNVATDAAPSVMTERLLITGSGQVTVTPGSDTVLADATGLIVGHTAQLTVSDGDGATNLIPEVQVIGTGKADSSLLLASFNTTNDNTVGPTLAFLKSGHATAGSNTIVASGEVLGDVVFFGADGTDFESAAAAIRAEVDGTPGVGDMPGRLLFMTSADNAETLTERMRISADGGIAAKGRLTTTDGITSGTARVVGGRAYANVAAADNVTAVASNNAHVDFANTYSIPASTLNANSVTRIQCSVRVTDASGTDTLEVKLYIGGTTLVTTTAFDPDGAGDHVNIDFTLVSRAAAGAAVEHVGMGSWTTLDGSTTATGSVVLAPTNLATNGALIVKASAKWSSNTASTSARLEILNVDIT